MMCGQCLPQFKKQTVKNMNFYVSRKQIMPKYFMILKIIASLCIIMTLWSCSKYTHHLRIIGKIFTSRMMSEPCFKIIHTWNIF